MKRTILLFLGNIWMFPNLLVSLFLLACLRVMGSVRLGKATRRALRANVVPGKWLANKMASGGWRGFAVGAVIFIGEDCTDRTLVHEERHVLQQMVFGVFQPILYVLISLFIYAFVWNKHSYYDNLFERDARKAAGQRVDIPKSYWKGDRWIWW